MNRIALKSAFFTLLFLAVLLCFITGCEQRHYTKKTKQTVKVYKQHKHKTASATPSLEADNDDDLIYWYILDYNNTYYYYSSPTYYPPSSYSTFNWSSAKANVESPITEVSKELEPVTEEVVPNDELGQTMEETIDTTEQQISDMVSEGNPNTDDSDSSSDNGSSDSGSSDSGGGDSGGGDGGGGGD